jgi:hypothetical protein
MTSINVKIVARYLICQLKGLIESDYNITIKVRENS